MKTKICEGIHWVGYVDWTVRDFHSYTTHRGTSYNAYLIQDEKTALVDTVKEPYAEYLLRHIAAHAPLESLDYVICNHAELDHAGALPDLLSAAPNARVVCNRKCAETLGLHHDTSGWRFHIVNSGDTLSLGKRTLHFVNTPMLHWPESMFTYVPEERLLFSMDAFGQHYAYPQRFDDDAPIEHVFHEAKTYYANIVMRYGRSTQKALELAASLDIATIAPAHGIIWRKHIPEILARYADWAVCRPVPKVLVVFDSMWDSTAKMAEAILDGASVPGVEAQIIHIRRTDLTNIATEVFDAACIAFGSSTLNQCMMPMAAAALTYLKGLAPSGKTGFAFGSHGWSRGGPEDVDDMLHAMKWEVTRGPLRAQYRPTPEILEECRQAGADLARRALEKCAEN